MTSPPICSSRDTSADEVGVEASREAVERVLQNTSAVGEWEGECQNIIVMNERDLKIVSMEMNPLIVSVEMDPLIVSVEMDPLIVSVEMDHLIVFMGMDHLIVSMEMDHLIVFMEMDHLIVSMEMDHLIVFLEKDLIVSMEEDLLIVSMEKDFLIVSMEDLIVSVENLIISLATVRATSSPKTDRIIFEQNGVLRQITSVVDSRISSVAAAAGSGLRTDARSLTIVSFKATNSETTSRRRTIVRMAAVGSAAEARADPKTISGPVTARSTASRADGPHLETIPSTKTRRRSTTRHSTRDSAIVALRWTPIAGPPWTEASRIAGLRKVSAARQ